MLVASFTSLLLPALETTSFSIVLLGFLLGTILVASLDHILPHEHMVKGYEGPVEFRGRIEKIWLMVFALMIHNLPEGLAVGATSILGLEEGLLTATAIGIQDIPEGFAISFSLIVSEKKPLRAFIVSTISGFSETGMAVLAALITSYSTILLPVMLALASGSMIYVVSHEIIPETHRYGYETLATIGFMIGFITMLWLDTMF